MAKSENFTYQEIYSQPDIWLQSINELNSDISEKILGMKNFDQVILTGCGSTYYLSIWGARAIQTLTGQLCKPLPASELWLNTENWIDPNKKTLLIAVSRSGETSETVLAMKKFTDQGLGTSVVVTCYPDSGLAKLAKKTIAVPLAQEKSIAQTRSFTNMMLGLSFLTERESTVQAADRIASQQKQLFDDYQELMADLGKDRAIESIFFLGSGPRYGIACEAMLKMKEMSLSYAEAYHTLEFRHGPMSMANEKSLVVGLLGNSNVQYELDVLCDMKKLGARILALGNLGDADIPVWLDSYIQINFDGLGMAGDVLCLPLLQLLAYERSLANGHNPDKPSNLSAVVVLDE